MPFPCDNLCVFGAKMSQKSYLHQIQAKNAPKQENSVLEADSSYVDGAGGTRVNTGCG
jgi:hypothetical protein